MNPELTSLHDESGHSLAVSARRTRTVRWTLASLSLSMLMPSLDTSIANAGLPGLATAFGASFHQVQWIVLIYLLVITTLIVIAGRLGDLIGRRRLLLVGIGLFTAASLLCGMASTLWTLVAARAAQGLGAAVMLALTVSFVGETVPKTETGRAMGLLGTISALGTTLGPTLGGLLIAGAGWQAIFLINVPLGLLNLALAYRFLPADQQSLKAPVAGVDYLGSLLLAMTLAAYAMAMTFGGGHFGQINLVLILLAMLGGVLFMVAQTKVPSPLIRLATLSDPPLRAGLTMSMLVSTVLMTTLVVGPFYLSRALGLGAVAVGMALSAGPLFAAISGLPAGRVVDRFGTRRITVAALIGITAGTSALSLIPTTLGIAGYIAPIIIVTTSYALFQTANNTAVMLDVHQDQRGVIAGLLSLSRNLGLITGASVMGAVFTLASASADVTTASPEAVAVGMRTTFAVATVLILSALGVTLGIHRQNRDAPGSAHI